MKKRIIFEILFICVFGLIGWHLFNAIGQIKSNSPELKAIESSNNLVFSGGMGIDIMGNYIDSISVNKMDEAGGFVVAFLLRYNSLSADLQFWNEVNSHLSGYDNMKLTAYCENDRCIEAIKKNQETVHFTVLEYGIVGDMQALIDADMAGEFWLLGNVYKKINWRDDNIKPTDIAISITGVQNKI